MFSRILVKLIDEAIIPAITLLVVKLLSAVAISQYHNISFEFGPTGFIYNSTEDFLLINSYSTLAMIIVLILGLFYVLIKAHLFHESHIEPATTSKLYALNLSSFIQASFDLYSQGSIWLSYSYLLMFISIVMAYSGMLYVWVLVVSAVLNLIATYLFILDVEKEMGLSKAKSPEKEEVVISWGDVEL